MITRARVAAGIMILGVLLQGCSLPQPPALPTVPNGTEQMPGPAYVHITGEPATTPSRLVFGYKLPDGSVSQQTDMIEQGATIEIDRTFYPGVHQLLVDGATCDGAYELKAEMVIELQVRLHGDACEATVTGIRKAVEPIPESN